MYKQFFDKLFITRLLEDISSYFKVYDYLKIKASAAKSGKVKVKNEKDFWKKILGETFREAHDTEQLETGTILSFKNFFLTDWAPKMPGGLWTKDGHSKLHEIQDRIDILQVGENFYPIVHPHSKIRHIRAGYGSIRVNPIGNEESNYVYMSMLSPEIWKVDYGIPVIISKSVYTEFLHKSKKGAVWIEEAEGILIRNEGLPLKNFIASSIGHNLSEELQDEMSQRPHLPSCYVYFPSRLNLKLRENDSHPETTAWTMFESKHEYEPNSSYGLTYWRFNPYEKDAFVEVSKCLNKYVDQFGGKKILTDYDGLVPRLNATIPINKDPKSKHLKELKKIVKNLTLNKE